ncbi:MAG: hypothetical protein WC440_03750 [Candidatus Omnitrophota bacterium]|jgi:hypothetical protein
MIKYRAEFDNIPKIVKCEIDRETKKSVWANGHRNAQKSRNGFYFYTFAEAKLFLVELFEARAKEAHRTLEVANGHLGNVKGLKESVYPLKFNAGSLLG